MNRIRLHLAAAAGAVLLLADCSTEPTYDEAADQCAAALKALPKDAKATPRPKPCERLTEEDYNTLVMDKVIDGLGWTDANGNIDREKLYRDTLNGKQ